MSDPAPVATPVATVPPTDTVGGPPGPVPNHQPVQPPARQGQEAGAPPTPVGAPAPAAYAKADPAHLVNLPDVIKQHAPCCVWRAVPRPGTDKPAKVPYDPKTGQPAKPGDLSTFGSYAEAIAALSTGNYTGIGIAVVGQLAAVDIDGCVDAAGNLSEMAKDIITTLSGYTEYSPSGTGIRVLALVREGYAVDKGRYYINNQELHLEIYVGGVTTKYVTVTGNTLAPGMDLMERTGELTMVLDKYMVRPQPLASTPTPAHVQASGPPADPAAIQAADQQLLDEIAQTSSGPRLAALLAGDMAECGGDHSSADMTACNILAAHTTDAAQIDRIIRSSALMRPKWDRQQSGSTYGAITINKAIASAVQYRQAHGELTPEQVRSVFVQAGPQQGAVPGRTASQPAQAVPAIPAPPKPKCISAKELASLQLPQVVYLVDELLPEGTTIFTGPSKARKSFEVLALGLDIAAGTRHMKYGTTQRGVLYLALEDSWGRIQGRMMHILGGAPVPDDFFFWTEAPSLDTGLLAALDEHLTQHPSTKLVIIDTFQRIRGAAKRGESSYATDYREMCALKNWGLSRGVSILLVHHNRKMTDPDAFNMISGTNGIMGSADTIWVIIKEKRLDDSATLHVTGRDVLPQELALRFNGATLRWECLGPADDVQAQRDKAAYDNDELVLTIRGLLNANGGRWSGCATDILLAGGQKGRLYGCTNQDVGLQLKKLSDKLLQYDGIRHTTSKSNGTGGVRHHFADSTPVPPPPAMPTGRYDPGEDNGGDE